MDESFGEKWMKFLGAYKWMKLFFRVTMGETFGILQLDENCLH